MNDTELLNLINKDFYNSNLKMGFQNLEFAKSCIDSNKIGYININDYRYKTANDILIKRTSKKL